MVQGAYAVRWQLRVRHCVCDHPPCPRQSFTERVLPEAAPWARRTRRRAQLLLACGRARGGEVGARLVARLELRPRPDPLLRLGQAAPAPDASAPQRLGVDAWAWRRGPRSGTILVNREDHRGRDLLPERSGRAWPPGSRRLRP
jgi:hypothetical protein